MKFTLMPFVRALYSALFAQAKETPVDFAIIGIGNPGARYAATRHNVGFMVVDALVATLQDVRRKRSHHNEIYIGFLANGVRVACTKPSTYVNKTGLAMQELLDMFNIKESQCLVIVDDFNLNVGRLRLRRDGSDGGHNGLKSIIAQVGTSFPRLRVGIGPIPTSVKTIDFVLGEFDTQNRQQVDDAVRRAAQCIKDYCEHGIEAAMNTCNK